LQQLFEEDNAKGVNAEHVRKINQILALLDAATTCPASIFKPTGYTL
jgi:hypothetical protein